MQIYQQQTGWVCPICGMVNAPFMPTCANFASHPPHTPPFNPPNTPGMPVPYQPWQPPHEITCGDAPINGDETLLTEVPISKSGDSDIINE